MDVQTIKNYVREQLDVDDEELPDSLLNIYLQEAFDRTMAFDNRWPRNEAAWSISKVPGEPAAALPLDLNPPSLSSVFTTGPNGHSVLVVDQKTAEDWFGYTDTGSSEPTYASVWQGKMHLWPTPALDSSIQLTIRGYRQPVWTQGASDIPDLDPRLHVTLSYFAIALAYAQQEDEILEGVYMARWDRDLRQQLRALLDPVHNRPLVLGGMGPAAPGRSVTVNLPT
jgi:hypothetical protein